MTVEQTIQQINQACDDLTETFAELAESAGPAYDQMMSGIGRIKQWEVLYYPTDPRGQRLPAQTEYWDTKPRWWQKLLRDLEVLGQVDHPRQEEAREAARELFGDIADNDEVYEARVEDITETPRNVGDMMTAWLDIVDGFATDVAQVIPTSTTYIATSGGMTGWRSPDAAAGYSATVTSQDSAATKAAEVINGLLDNCKSFLDHMQSSLSEFASITQKQDEFYTKVSQLPTELTIESVLGLIGDGVQAVNDVKDLELSKARAMGADLTSSIGGLLSISALDREITMMGESAGDNGWPMPAPMPVHDSGQHPQSRDELAFNAQYFKDHSVFWDDVSGAIAPLRDRANAIPQLPEMFIRLPAFSANQSTALNNLNNRIAADVLGKGVTATSAVSDKLEETIRNYLAAEAENEAEAGSLMREYFDE